MRKILSYFFAAFLILSAIAHLVKPGVYAPMIPDFIPDNVANILAFITELATGILLVLPKYRKWGGLAFMALMIAFLPIHIWDYTKDLPMMGSKMAAIVRIVVQFLLIYAGWWIYRSSEK